MKIIHYILVLSLLCGVATGLLTFVNTKTSKVIAQNQQKKALIAVMDNVLKGQFPGIRLSSNPDSVAVCCTIKDDETGKEKQVRIINGYNSEGAIVVRVVENSSTTGYAGPIKLLVGIDSSGKIIGTTVLTQTETPGLGDKINEPEFADQFLGFSADSGDIRITKFGGNIESISGASISSNAFTSAVNEALKLAHKRAEENQ